jgi:hypothetical protein
MVNRMKCKLEGMKIVYENLGYMITFESEDGLVMIRDLEGEAISLRHMLKLVDLVLVTQHNESKGKRKKKEPAYDPDLFVRDPTPTPSMTAEEQNAHLVSRRPVVMSQISWLLNENKDYGKLVRELPSLRKELSEIDAVLVVAR